jgi:hypothetical protein
MSTAADELRAAARTLRALLADRELTPGPWLSMDRGDRLLWNGEGAEDQAPVYVVDEPMSNGANADYIAVMHPDVGHALADWLDEEADRRDASLVAAIQIWGNAEHPDAVADRAREMERAA